MDLGVSGLASGFDWRSLVDRLSEFDRIPQRRLYAEQSALRESKNAYGTILTQLKVFRGRVDALTSPALFSSRTTSVSDNGSLVANATDKALPGNHTFHIMQLATAARQAGAAGVSRPLHTTADVSTLALGAAGFATPIVGGTFTVNGTRVEVDPSETLQQVFERIASATGNSVTATYDPATDRIRLSSAGAIVLGSATDTGNFLQAARLHNNGTGEVTSASTLGRLQLTANLETAPFSTGVTDDGEGTGMFRINGVEIEFGVGDTIDQVLRRIHDSAAGVSASYDVVNDRFLIANRTTGDVGIALEDVRGNFLAATGLAGGTLERGNDLFYTVNNGGVLRSQSNTITEGSSGLVGLTVTALREGETSTVHVQTDTGAIREAIVQFLEEYNKVQSMLESQTGRSIDSKGAVTAGVLAGELEAGGIGARLRSLAYSHQAGLGGSIRHLEALGIVSNGTNNQLQLADPSRLDEALANDLTSVRDLFLDPVHGLAPRMGGYLEQIAGEDGRLSERQGALDRQAGQIDVQLLNLERLVQSNRQRMINSFVTMETVQANLNQQLEFLQRRFAANNNN
jgi:flagellar hook-associated protein 2